MSRFSKVQKKALKKRAAETYPPQVATTRSDEPMSDSSFLAWVADFGGFHAGGTFAEAMESMIEHTKDRQFTKKQYDLLRSAISEFGSRDILVDIFRDPPTTKNRS